MLNLELKKDIDAEINKAKHEIKDFLFSDYFRETMDLIFKVSHLNEEQSEAVELETVLFILELSNYPKIDDAISTECYIENNSTVKQIVDDLKTYIFIKINISESKDAPDKIIVKKEEEQERGVVSVLENTNTTGINMITNRKDLMEVRDIVQNIKTNNLELSDGSQEGIFAKKTETNLPLGDVYLEQIPEQEKTVQAETLVKK